MFWCGYLQTYVFTIRASLNVPEPRIFQKFPFTSICSISILKLMRRESCFRTRKIIVPIFQFWSTLPLLKVYIVWNIYACTFYLPIILFFIFYFLLKYESIWMELFPSCIYSDFKYQFWCSVINSMLSQTAYREKEKIGINPTSISTFFNSFISNQNYLDSIS
jgi:hypothetical protein